ncbi:hypothetical protein SOVF_190450 isoform A [Spinacia oleracea]|uniref:Growth-regulating factor n=1 Tax=Spinacia oleracea TaxID=3562 RepID=A0A9R0JK51_SPIOL|nr:growth-regulating factor 1-like isoform X2 [Spinacia oleracea]KNA05431.1 hypothetical protein SOVF_190450 isoform A [Spinacia oleracea]
MDFGLVGSVDSSEQQQILEGKPNGSGLLIKQERPDPFGDEDNNRAAKMVKRGQDLGLRSDNNNVNVLPKQQMLSFSSSNKPQQLSFLGSKDVGFIAADNNNNNNNNNNTNAQNLFLSYFQHQPPPPSAPNYSRTPAGNLNGNMHGSFTGIRGPFTPAQWIELEHQAMIYKYLTANVPVPHNLLIPIRKALCSSVFPGFSIGSYPPHSYGWGAFHLGFSGNTDPEPGRCRRTDGKKWRCSRDAVPDQKYCERHINRGRHRSRKPVEGLTGQAASGPTNTKEVPAMSMPSSLVTSSGGASNSSTVTIAHHHHHVKPLQPSGATNATTDSIVNRFHDEQGLSVSVMPPPTTMNLKTNDTSFSLDDSSQSEFGLVSTDSLLNPTQKSYNNSSSSSSILGFNSQQTQDQQYPLRHFMDVWPKDNSTRSTIPWPEDLKSDWTQLSMSIPNQENKTAVSPLRLSRELDPSETGLGLDETGMKQQNAWIPISWGNNNNNNNSMGGPLGEVLNNTSKNIMTSALNLKGSDQRCGGGGGGGSPQLGSSPTGVLQKSTYVSLSNSSSAEGGASPCDDIFGLAAHASSTFVPSM